MLGIVSDSEDRVKLEEYLRLVGCESMPVAFVAGDVLRSYKLSMTPATLVIANDGKVEKAWFGKWGSNTVTAASSYLDLTLSPR